MSSQHGLGGRLPLLDPAAMTPAQRHFYDGAMADEHPWSVRAGFQFVADDQRLIGPHNAFLRRPEVSERFGDFAKAASRGGSLPPQVREVVTLAVGSAWSADYEVYAHRIVAESVGISPGDAAALAAGRPPTHLGHDAEVAFALVRALTVEHRVDDALYAEALATFGEEGLVDIWAVTAVYLGVSSILDLFAVPAPEMAA